MNKFWKDKTFVFFLILLIIALGIRIIGVNQAFFDDEIDYVITTKISTFYGLNNIVLHPPLVTWVNMFFGLFTTSLLIYRFVPLILGLLTIFFVYLISRKLYDEKSAIFASAIMAFSFYHVLASLQVGDEGGFLAFLYTFAFYCYLNHENGKKHWYYLSAIAAGLALLAKESSILLLGILFIYELTNKNKFVSFENIKRTVIKTLPLAIIAFLIFSIYPLLNLLSPIDYTEGVKNTVSSYFSFGFNLQGPGLLLLWATPFLIFLTLISLLKIQKEDRLFLIWIGASLISYLFFINLGDHSRYFMNVIPAMAILSGRFLSKIKFTKKNVILFILIFLIFFIVLGIYNTGNFRYIPRDLNTYLNELKNFRGDGLFSYTTSSGPLFLVSIASIIISYFWAFFFFILSSLWIKRKLIAFGKISFIILLGITFAFNIFVLQEYLFHGFHANPSQVIKEMVKEPYQLPVYSDNTAILFYLNEKYLEDQGRKGGNWYYTGVYGEYIDRDNIKKVVKERGGTIFLLNYPILPENSPILELVKECKLKKSFTSKNIELGQIYVC
ncbi:MAG: glycosyltransferase family 39 protein [Candidatus Woesearchaeota archaeon]|nr:MAG: glycosyltransferase family 39 protein [Candidatus Woesearchaeota archaeon]